MERTKESFTLHEITRLHLRGPNPLRRSVPAELSDDPVRVVFKLFRFFFFISLFKKKKKGRER